MFPIQQQQQMPFMPTMMPIQMPGAITRVGNLIFETNANGTITVYRAEPEAVGISFHEAMVLMAEQQAQPGGLTLLSGGASSADLPKDEQTEEAIAITHGNDKGQQIGNTPVWMSDPRVFAILVPVRMPRNDEADELHKRPSDRRANRVSQADAKKMITQLAKGSKEIPGGNALTVRSTSKTDEVGKLRSAGEEGKRQYWAFRIRRKSLYEKLSPPILLSNGMKVVLGRVHRNENGLTRSRALRGLPSVKPFAKALKKLTDKKSD